jgi:hypothetical protein
MKRLIGMAAALVLTATAGSASAQAISATDRADMQCFVVSAVLAGQYEEGSAEQTGLASGLLYFLGRLEGRTPGTDWLQALADFILSPDDATLWAEIESHEARCLGVIEARGLALAEWGETVAAASLGRGD